MRSKCAANAQQVCSECAASVQRMRSDFSAIEQRSRGDYATFIQRLQSDLAMTKTRSQIFCLEIVQQSQSAFAAFRIAFASLSMVVPLIVSSFVLTSPSYRFSRIALATLHCFLRAFALLLHRFRITSLSHCMRINHFPSSSPHQSSAASFRFLHLLSCFDLFQSPSVASRTIANHLSTHASARVPIAGSRTDVQCQELPEQNHRECGRQCKF
jgi:hypothetical protein